MERLVVVPNGRLIAAGCLTGVIRASLVVLIAGAVLGPRSFPVDARQPGQGGPGHEENCQRPRRRRAKVVCGRQPTEPCLTRRLMGRGAVAQLAEHLVCNQGVRGSNPLSSTCICAGQSLFLFWLSSAPTASIARLSRGHSCRTELPDWSLSR